ncbi:fimbrial protein [Providencia rettgeri]
MLSIFIKRVKFIMKSYYFLIIFFLSTDSLGFTCRSQGHVMQGSATINVNVKLEPVLQQGQNVVVNLGNSIECKNDDPGGYVDLIRVGRGSAYSTLLSSFNGSLSYYGNRYSFPTNQPTAFINHNWANFRPWQAVLLLTPVDGAGGVVIKTGDPIALIVLEKKSEVDNSIIQTIRWNIIASNDVVIPTGGCDVSSRNINVDLPPYPATQSFQVNVHCLNEQKLSFFLTGPTSNSNSLNNIFANTASISPAKGVGIKIMRQGSALSTNQIVSLGNVGPAPVDLGLSATYETVNEAISAGNVQSVVGINFTHE